MICLADCLNEPTQEGFWARQRAQQKERLERSMFVCSAVGGFSSWWSVGVTFGRCLWCVLCVCVGGSVGQRRVRLGSLQGSVVHLVGFRTVEEGA